MNKYIFLIFIIIFIILLYIVYLLGKSTEKNKQNKKINNLQQKILNGKYNKINNKEELIKKLKNNLFSLLLTIFLLFSLSSCSINKNTKFYIPLQEYTKDELEQMIYFLQNNNIEIIDKIFIDYGNLREKVRNNNKY